ncbi:MAG: response regulator [Planctomycetes bacterium]|nr:response regulator [Planctomycetota bacterium]
MARILYVEGKRYCTSCVQEKLAQRGHCVEVAHCAERAMLRIDQKEKFDALVLDLYLPGMDGAEFCRWMDRWAEVEKTPKLAFTWEGYDIPTGVGDDLPRWLPVDHLLKEIKDVDELTARVEDFLKSQNE